MRDLYQKFLNEAPIHFSYLEEVYRFQKRAESGEWFARIVYSGADSEVTVFFGDREFCANVLVARRLPGHPALISYALWEWLAALGIQDAAESYAEWIQTPQQLSAFLEGAAAALDLAITEILSAGPSVTLEIERSREEVLSAHQREERGRAHRSAASRASEAFRDRDFVRVVSLLADFESDLTPAERKKLKYAREKLGTGAA